MAKNSKGNSGGMIGPMYAAPNGHELGGHKVGGPKGGKSIPDPIGLTNGIFATGKGGKQEMSQKHDKE